MKSHYPILFLAAVATGLGFGTAAHADPDIVVVRPAPRVYVAPAPRVYVAPAPRVIVKPAPYVVRPSARYCGVYGCSGTVTTTGPHGNSVVRSGSASCANGTCTRSTTVTGPAGRSGSVKRSISR